MKRQINYYRKQVDYKNIHTHGDIVETVIFNTPELTYKYHIFILHNGKQTEKLYRRSLSGAKKSAYKQLQIPHKNGQAMLIEKAKPVFVRINGLKVEVPGSMEIPIRG
ncbi:hypothetical protein E4N89_03315 [Treponema denticola]|uniref:hypothetical protein n=1 Tax=Treponema denticola TaxID=158 RepID=UPI003D926279